MERRRSVAPQLAGALLGGSPVAPALADLLRQALHTHEVERAELLALREEVARLRGANAATAREGLDRPLVRFEHAGSSASESASLQLPKRPPKQQDQQQEQQQEQQGPQVSTQSSPRHHKSCIATLQGDEDEDAGAGKSICRIIAEKLERMSIALILANIVMLWVQLQYEGHLAGIELDMARHGVWPPLENAFFMLEHMFNILFLLEFVARLFLSRSEFFYKNGAVEKFNVFDMSLVFSTSLDLYVIRPVLKSSGMNLTIFRPLRFVRVIRTLRVLDTLKFLMTLRQMLNAIVASFHALFWSMVLLLVVMLMAALFLCQSLQESLKPGQELTQDTGEWTDNLSEWTFRYYGTPIRAVWTVFELSFSGGWPIYVRRLVEQVSNWYGLFFFIYIMVVVFALFRTITALFLKDTMELAAQDAELAVQEKMRQKEELAKTLMDFFEAADTSGDGNIDKEEFDEILRNEKVRTWLSLMELNVDSTQELFAILDDGDGLVSFEEFCQSVRLLKGGARSEDVIAIKRNGQSLRHELRALHGAVAGLRALVLRLSAGDPPLCSI